MAVSNLVDLRTRVLNKATIIGSDPGMDVPKTTAAVNAALRQVALDHDWPWLQQTATVSVLAGTSSYAVPTDYLRTIHLIDASTGSKLVRVPLESVDALGSRTGEPAVFAIFGGNLLVAPKPTAAQTLTHRYIRKENTLTTDTSTPLVPVEFEDGVVEYATYLVLRQLKEAARAAECLSAYQEWKKRATDNVQQSREPLRMTHRPGGWL